MKKSVTVAIAVLTLLSLAKCGNSGASNVDNITSQMEQEYENEIDTAGDYDIATLEKESVEEEVSSMKDEIQESDQVVNTEEATSIEEGKKENKKESKEENKQENVVDVEPIVEEQKPEYVITDVSKTMYVNSSANVRSQPDKNEDKVGTLSPNDEVKVTGLVDNGWYRVSYNGGEAYIKADLLSDEKKTDSAVDTYMNSENVNATGTENVIADVSSNVTSNEEAGITGTEVVVPATEDTQGNLVWVPTKGGKKYHSKSSCSGMEDPMQVTKEHAEANNYTACKKCYK